MVVDNKKPQEAEIYAGCRKKKLTKFGLNGNK